MKGIAITMLSAALLFATSTATALRITDSSTSDRGARSTYSSLTKTNTSSTYGYQNSYGVSVGMVVAFTSQNDIATPDRIKWLECNGQTFSRDQYPELYDALGVNVVPNLNGQFMRGTSDKNLVLTRKDDTIKSHTINIPEHTHTFNLTATGTVQTLKNGGTIYVPKLSSASDTITSVKKETVKTGTEQYVCGTTTETYECNCTGGRTETYVCGTIANGMCKDKYSFACRCFGVGDNGFTINNQTNHTAYEGLEQQTCDSLYSDKNVQCTVINRWGPTMTECRDTPKYCTRTVAGSCDTCTRTVNKYCTRDVYDERLTTNKSTPATAISKPVSGTSALQNGKVSGAINSSGELTGHYEGAEETAPKHTYVRYFIRAIP